MLQVIEMTNVEYDKISGIITATAEFEFRKYDIIADTNTWEMISTDDNIPDIILYKCESDFKRAINGSRFFPSSYWIAWY